LQRCGHVKLQTQTTDSNSGQQEGDAGSDSWTTSEICCASQ
jgi:hypothetical protein